MRDIALVLGVLVWIVGALVCWSAVLSSPALFTLVFGLALCNIGHWLESIGEHVHRWRGGD